MKTKKICSFIIISILIFSSSNALAITSDSTITNFKPATKDTLIISINSQVKDHNPVISNSAYDRYALSSVYLPLMFVTPVNDPTFTHWQIFPGLAASWNHSTDAQQLTWFVNLKSGLKWSDGAPLNASDVQFGIYSILDPATDSRSQTTYNKLFNDTDYMITSNNGTLSTLEQHAVQVINATCLKFQFGRFDPFQVVNIAGFFPMPKHFLGDLPFANWATNETDTGSMPIPGNGPYVYTNTSSDKNTVYLDANPLWDTAYATKFADGPFGKVPSIPHIIIIVNADPTAAVTALKTRQIDWIDAQSGLAPVYNQITSPAVAITYPDDGFQEIGLNQRSPIWGINPLDPAINYNETPFTTIYNRDNQTAKWILEEKANATGPNGYEWFYQNLNFSQRLLIRKAIDYSIDRQGIINSLPGGQGYQLATRLIPQTGLVNSTIKPRQYNLTKASELLTKVFGFS